MEITRLTPIRASKKRGNRGEIYWFYKCTCGKTIERNSSTVNRGDIKSCGCLKLELLKRPKTHGMTKTLTYKTWTGIKTRCLNKKSPAYKTYGAVGITMCKRWLKFENFYKDMGEKPTNMTIDRIDNSKGYCKKNCRWATMQTQQNNRTNNKNYTINGVTKTMAEWVREYGRNKNTVKARLRNGWTIEKALEVPNQPRATGVYLSVSV